ncbi:metallophosphoesterase family protein [Treponema brennaborense]|uniref:Nuclease SbcCD subunit D n=1 Tax=Treponema brennaborense (strain DSM 12168 / CIP 105900 / DD5/3) TaxID=906968 RepID=F4LIL8_TREBD|nr:exonuclease subunit SbcD [Treponema brennaborense]AEE17243.1 nuclease SbcCD, D subunit [Treponema brennaborense DSM 12168]
MKFLQTGDLHLGKIFYERSLLEDQTAVLDTISAELTAAHDTDEPYDALLVAGDVYDRAVPPPEAVALFDAFLTEIRANCPELHVVIIPGNHDSARRLSFAAGLLDAQNIHLITTPQRITVPVVLEKKTHGETECAAIYGLPFLTPGFTGTEAHRQQDMAQEAVSRIAAAHEAAYAGIPAVLCAHLFARNGVTSDSERLFVGTAEQVAADIFKPFAYTALGHLHSCQQMSETVWYAGSPLAYSFGEAGAQKYLLRVTLDFGTQTVKETDKQQNAPMRPEAPAGSARPAVTVEKIPITPPRPVVKLSGPFEQFYRDDERRFAGYTDAYLEISCTDRALVENPMAQLKPKYPYLLSVLQETAVLDAGTSAIAQRKALLESNAPHDALSEEIFTAFMNDICAELPENFDEEKKAFRETARELAGGNE